MVKYLKYLACMSLLGLLASCGSSEIKQKDPYAALPPDVREQVVKLDEQINELQAQLEKALRAFQNEDVDSQEEVFDKWQDFSESVKQSEQYQEQAKALREKIISLQQEKVHLLENGVPKKATP